MTESLPGRTMPEGSKSELIGLVADDERMAGIVAALEADDDVRLEREPIDDLALALVAPLGADHHHIRHGVTKSPIDHMSFDKPDSGLLELGILGSGRASPT